MVLFILTGQYSSKFPSRKLFFFLNKCQFVQRFSTGHHPQNKRLQLLGLNETSILYPLTIMAEDCCQRIFSKYNRANVHTQNNNSCECFHKIAQEEARQKSPHGYSEVPLKSHTLAEDLLTIYSYWRENTNIHQGFSCRRFK